MTSLTKLLAIPLETFLILLATMAFVWMNNKDHPLVLRAVITLSSAALGYSLAEDAADFWLFGGNERVALAAITAFGWAMLELVIAFIKDTDKIMAILRAWRGK